MPRDAVSRTANVRISPYLRMAFLSEVSIIVTVINTDDMPRLSLTAGLFASLISLIGSVRDDIDSVFSWTPVWAHVD